MKGKIAILLVCIMLFVTACQSKSSVETETSTNANTSTSTSTEQTDTTTQATQAYSDDETFEVPADVIRSESSIVNDSKTQSVITSQDSYQIGTYIKISIYDEYEAPTKLFDEIFSKIDYFEKMISKNIETSEVDKINANAGIEPVVVSDPLWDLINKGLEYSNLSGGKFDISIGPLVDLWGIGTDNARLPGEDEIKASMALVNYKDVILDETNHSVYLNKVDMKLDLGAIAKGYIADAIKEIILSRGFDAAIINLGGNVLTVGNKPNSDYWAVGVRDPNGGQSDIVGILQLKDNSIVSSGVYERYFIQDGVRYHHILNPFTGYPETNELAAISIISEKSVDGDGLSTSLFVMGLEDAYQYAETRDDIEVLLVTYDNKIYYTDGLADKFILTNTLYENIGALE